MQRECDLSTSTPSLLPDSIHNMTSDLDLLLSGLASFFLPHILCHDKPYPQIVSQNKVFLELILSDMLSQQCEK